MKRKYERGFTLLEIIATISLILVIMSMAVPMYTNIVDKQKIKTDIATAMQLSQCAKTFYVENKNADKEKLKEHINEMFDKMPKSKYLEKEFEVELNGGKPNVKVGSQYFVENGEPKDESDFKKIIKSEESI